MWRKYKLNPVCKQVMKELEQICGQTISCSEIINNKSPSIRNPPSTCTVMFRDEGIVHLSLNSRNLQVFPECILDLRMLEMLDLSYNQITLIPETIHRLENLVVLTLRKNQLKNLPNSFGKLKTLQYLDLNYNQLQSLPENFGNLFALTTLIAESNQLAILPESFGKLSNLKVIKLGVNKLKALPYSFGDLSALENLEIYTNELVMIPESFKKLYSLRILRIEGNNLNPLPEAICSLRGLEELDLSGNLLEGLPDCFGNFPSLRSLSLSRNKLSALPNTFGNLTTLKSLNLSFNQFVILPSSLWPLKNLTELDLRHNKLTGESRILAKMDSDPMDLGRILPGGLLAKGEIQPILDFCRKLASVQVFFSYSVADYNSRKYPLAKLADLLQKQEKILHVHHCMQDLKVSGHIDDFMDKNIPNCQFFIFFATKNSIRSKDCQHELQIAQNNGIKIIPVLGEGVNWSDLEILGCNRDYGFILKDPSLDDLVLEIYDYILKFKEAHSREIKNLRL